MNPYHLTLYYKGPLKAASGKNKRVTEKQAIRKAFHDQLKVFWHSEPFNEFFEHHFNKSNSSISKIGETEFYPFVSKQASLVVELEITFLRHEVGGRIISGGGDIDNRLKTLFDGMRNPHDSREAGDDLFEDNKCFTLLEDDALITGINITTDRLLVPIQNESEVVLLIKANIIPINYPMGGIKII